MRHNISRAALAATASLTAGVLATGCSSSPSSSSSSSTTALATSSSSSASGLEGDYEKVVGEVLPSVVQITTSSGLGSGVVFDDKGDIVTNDHVIAGASSLKVTPSNSQQPLPATVVGQFAPDDLAVVHVSNSSLKAASFGDSAHSTVGQIVLAMGNPLGLSGSVTNGIVSAVGRTVTSAAEGAFPGATTTDAIQTSAAINPGNSGGALVNLNGQVVGIPTLAATDPQLGQTAAGIGFAIPSDTVKSIAEQLIEHGKVTNSGRAALGVEVRTVTDAEGNSVGVGVVSVASGGGAQKAGIKAGDLITAVNGTSTPDAGTLSQVLTKFEPGQTVKVSVTHSDGSKGTYSVKLGELSTG